MVSLALPQYADAEVPRVVETQLVLQNAPAPAASLQLFRNGLLQNPGSDYLLSGFFVMPNPAPAAGDVFLCWYRF